MRHDFQGGKSHHFSNNNELPNILRVKCALAGDSGVGKSAILEVLNRDQTRFPENYSMTMGINVVVKSVPLEDSADLIEMYIYDSSGKEIYGEMIQKLWHNLCIIIIVFDVTSEASFNNCVMWLEKAKFLNKGTKLSGVLIGNKIDLEQRRKVHKNAAANFAQKHGMLYYECSAKNAMNINEAFRHVVQEWHKLYEKKNSAYQLLT